MNELHTMPLKVEKLLSSLAIKEMDNEQFGCYIKLLCYSWLNGGYVDANAMRTLCDCINTDKWERIKSVIGKWFDIKTDDGKIANSHLLEIYEDTLQTINKKSLAGKKSAEIRWKKPDANAMRTQCEGINNQSQNQSNISKEKNINIKKKVSQTPKNKYGDCGNVALTTDEHAKLLAGHGEDMTAKLIAKLDAYKGATGKKYKSDYQAILTWVVSAVVKDSQYASKQPDHIQTPTELTLDDFEGNQSGYDEYLRRREAERKLHGRQ